MRELAEYTGLSPAAVSYALRGQRVSAETEERVRAAADELGYEVDPIARALAGGATGVIGLLVGSLADFWTQELVRAVQRELYGAERSTLVADADGEPARELELAQKLIDQRVDGLIVVPIGPSGGGWAAIARQLPIVTIGDALPEAAPAGEVVFDNELGVRQALEHLGGRGHQRITVLSWALETSPDRQAERAVVASAAAPRARRAPRRRARTRSTARARSPSSCSRAPTARPRVLCLSDSIAYGVYAACAELGLAIPGDVAVAGFGDHPISRLLAPPLTSTVWDVEQAAACATGFLVQAIEADGPQATLREVVAPALHRPGLDGLELRHLGRRDRPVRDVGVVFGSHTATISRHQGAQTLGEPTRPAPSPPYPAAVGPSRTRPRRQPPPRAAAAPRGGARRAAARPGAHPPSRRRGSRSRDGRSR